MIPYGRQDITNEDIDAIISVLKSDFLTQGPAVPIFEQSVAKHVGSKHALAVNSATSALHIACLALGLKSDDWLWTTPITFVASANCGLYCGAKLDFVDIDPKTYNICPIQLRKKLIASSEIGRLPKVLVVVHLGGQSCDMEAISALSNEYGFRIIEDASHAIGGKYKGSFIGNCMYSDVTVFSFHPVKIITTAEGGMALTNSNELAEKMALLRSHGITRDATKMTKIPDGPWYYQQVQLGFNYRMTDLQAALGLSQIQRLDYYVTRRNQLATRYNQQLKDLPIMIPWQHSDSYSSFHLYIIRLKLNEIKKTHRQVFDDLVQSGIGVNLHYIPVHLQPYFQAMGFRAGTYREAEQYYQEAITLPLFPTLTDSQQDEVIQTLYKVLIL